jgi:hypothetical protein
MSRVYRSLAGACWVVGLLSLVVGVVLRLVPTLYHKTPIAPRGILILAGVLFLGVLATREMERMESPPS